MASFSRVPVVDVHNDNLREVWPSMILAMSTSAFIALDTELSGLGHRKKLNAKSVEDRYKNISETASSRSILSLGISCFKSLSGDPISQSGPSVTAADQSSDSYVVQTFNILLLCEDDFVVEPLSLKFLVRHGFDFNKQYDKGVPYYRGPDKETDQSIQSVRFLFSQLLSMRVPVILHNGLVDLMFLYENLYTSLPPTSAMFLADLTDMFPRGIIDTKYITDFNHLMPASYLEYVFRKCQRDSVSETSPLCRIHFPHFPPSYAHVTYRDCSISHERDVEANPDFYKDQLCQTYAGHGWCSKDKFCPKSHDIDLIIDVDNYHATRKSRKRKRRKENASKAENSDKSEDETVTMETEASFGCTGNSLTVPENNSKTSEKEGDQSTGICDANTSLNQSETLKQSVTQNQSINTHANGGHRAGYDAFMTGFIFAFYLARSRQEKDFGSFEEWKNKLYLVGKDYPLSIAKSSFTKQSKLHQDKLSSIQRLTGSK